MKVIFIADVVGVAKHNSVREVADGFALNYLLPRGLAVLATPEKIFALSQQHDHAVRQQQKDFNKTKGLAQQLNRKKVNLISQASKSGTLYAAVTPAVISQAINEQLKTVVDPEQIKILEPIKNAGEHKIEVRFGPQIKCELVVNVDVS